MPHSPTRRLACVGAAGSTGRRWRSYLVLLGCIAAAVTLIAVFPTLPMRQGYFGVLLGVIAVLVIVAMVGLGNSATDGRPAAQWSIDGLRTARGWYLVDDVPSGGGVDVEHVVVAPSAVLAVATVNLAQPLPESPGEPAGHRAGLDAAARSARAVRTFLRSQQLRDTPIVVPVLMVTGPGAAALPGGHRVDDAVHVVDATHPARWMHLFAAPRLSPAARRDLFERLGSSVRDDADTVPALHARMWREFRGGMAHERATRAARQQRARELRRRHGLRLVPPSSRGVTPGKSAGEAASA
ncbi:MAG: hypothetical protein ACRDVG_00925 [Jatrophihabitantaceae bacterium]